MSKSEISDRQVPAPSLPNVDKAVQSLPALSDISERDKPWDKHRKNSDIVASYYSGTEFHDHSQSINFCSQLLGFGLMPDTDEGTYKLKLRSARFCRKRHCCVCQWRRSLRWGAKAHKMIPRVVEDYPKYRWLFVTLTLKNCPIIELRTTLDLINESFKRFTKLKSYPAAGWIKSVEVTRGKDGSSHPHLHILMMVKPSYFKHSYLSQAKWVELWQQCLRIDYRPILDVQAIKKDISPKFIIPEILKYQCKESDLIADREWFLELTRQLKNTRAVAVGGILRGYMRELEEEPEDLIGEGDADEIDEAQVFFGWRKVEKRYRMVDI